jgi:hypothetical protein
LKGEVKDSLIIINYHLRSDGWHNADGSSRSTYYGVTGTPTLVTDGTMMDPIPTYALKNLSPGVYFCSVKYNNLIRKSGIMVP